MSPESVSTSTPTPAEAFHAHLDVCTRCRNHPFNLCAIGMQLLTATRKTP